MSLRYASACAWRNLLLGACMRRLTMGARMRSVLPATEHQQALGFTYCGALVACMPSSSSAAGRLHVFGVACCWANA